MMHLLNICLRVTYSNQYAPQFVSKLPFQGLENLSISCNPGRCHRAEISWAFSPKAPYMRST